MLYQFTYSLNFLSNNKKETLAVFHFSVSDLLVYCCFSIRWHNLLLPLFICYKTFQVKRMESFLQNSLFLLRLWLQLQLLFQFLVLEFAARASFANIFCTHIKVSFFVFFFCFVSTTAKMGNEICNCHAWRMRNLNAKLSDRASRKVGNKKRLNVLQNGQQKARAKRIDRQCKLWKRGQGNRQREIEIEREGAGKLTARFLSVQLQLTQFS